MSIKIQALSFSYGGGRPEVFSGFSVSLAPGITLLKGYSGCGKSTLLRLIAGFLRPQSGTVLVPSRGIAPDRAFQQRDLGFVFQGLNLLPDATLHRNLEIAATLAKVSRQELARREKNLGEQLGLLEYLFKRPEELSGGQQQRAAIARALIHQPKVLCLDEPTSGLDDLNTDVIRRTLTDFISADRYCIIATHDDRLARIANHTINFEQFMPIEPRLRAHD